MTRTEYKAKSTATRKAARRAIAHGFASHWSPLVSLMRDIHASPAMVAFHKREAMIDRIGSVGGADIGNLAYS
jgi:hypothetical protein